MKAIELTNVKKKINDQFVIGPIDLSFNTGCVVALVGSNGAGKSSMFRLMMGLVKAEQGNIRLVGHDLQEDAVKLKRETAYLSQTIIGSGGFTIQQLAELHRLTYQDWSKSRFREYINTFQLPLNKRLDTTPHFNVYLCHHFFPAWVLVVCNIACDAWFSRKPCRRCEPSDCINEEIITGIECLGWG